MSDNYTVDQWLEMLGELATNLPDEFAEAWATLPLVAALLMIEQWTGIS